MPAILYRLAKSTGDTRMLKNLICLLMHLGWTNIAVCTEMPIIPEPYAGSGWKQIFEAKGDLNKDSVDDKAIVVEAPEGVKEPGNWCKPESAFSEASARSLIVWLSQPDGTFDLSVDDPKLLLRADEGGVFGDPLEDITMERGALVVHYFGGSRWRWVYTQRFRLEADGFALIGYTDTSVDSATLATVTYDYNALSGKVLIEVEESEDPALRESDPPCMQCQTGEDCPEKDGCYAGTKRATTGKTWMDVGRKPLIKLADFRCWEEGTGLLRHVGLNNGR